jgi:hypothetical protein
LFIIFLGLSVAALLAGLQALLRRRQAHDTQEPPR